MKSWSACVNAVVLVCLALLPSWAMAQSDTNKTLVPGSQAGSDVSVPAGSSDSPTSKDPGYHLHDGLYIRLALGGGYVHDKLSSDRFGSATITGAAIPIDLMLGWALVPGLTLGGGIWLAPLSSPKGEYHGTSTAISSKNRIQYSRFGLFADYYPNPREGLHALGNIAYAGMTIVEDATDKLLGNAKGVAFTAGIGYEFWIGAQWSAGLLAQLGYAALSAPNESHSLIAPGLIATFTYQ